MNKLLLKEYSDLPDYMTVEDLEKYFTELINYAIKISGIDDESIAEALYELSDRQWHTYELINKDIKDSIEEWINKVWNTNSTELIDSITSIIGMLGLVKSFELVKKSINEDISCEVREILKMTIKELNIHVGDPYSGMRHL